MTKKINSFWLTDKAPVDDLDAIQEYLKPRGQEELLGFFAPDPPGVEEPHEEPQQLDSLDAVRDELLELYGLTPEEFALSAVNEPELWDDDELERISQVLAGESDPKTIADLAHEFVSGSRKVKAKPDPVVHGDPLPVNEDDFFGMSDENLEPPTSMPGGTGVDLSLPIGAIDVGEWWKEKK